MLSAQLSAVVRAAGCTEDELEQLVRSPERARLRLAALRLLKVVGSEAAAQADLDVLLDVLLKIHEVSSTTPSRRPPSLPPRPGSNADLCTQAGLLAALSRAPLSALRRYDREHTHLLRPPAESWTPYHELVDLLSLVPSGGTLLDLGSGNGRTLLTAALLRPGAAAAPYPPVPHPAPRHHSSHGTTAPQHHGAMGPRGHSRRVQSTTARLLSAWHPLRPRHSVCRL